MECIIKAQNGDKEEKQEELKKNEKLPEIMEDQIKIKMGNEKQEEPNSLFKKQETEEVDKSRLAQEVVIYADKCSIEEELTRLRSHIMQFRNMLESRDSIGKKLDFLVQEMNRETNTIASKSVKLEITNLAIDIKTAMEDIREQIQNIE